MIRIVSDRQEAVMSVLVKWLIRCMYGYVGNQTARDSMKGRKQTRLQRQVGMAVEILLGLPGDGENKNKKRSRSAKKARDILKKRKTVIHLKAHCLLNYQKLAIGL